jgi:hypothetical protein
VRHRSREVFFFAGFAFLWTLYAYDVAGVGRLVAGLPLFSLTVPSRSQMVWVFGLACLAALGLERAAGPWPSDTSARRGAIAAGGWGGILCAVALVSGMSLYFGSHAKADRMGLLMRGPELSGRHGGFLLATAAAAAAALAALPLAGRRPWLRGACAAAVIATAFLQTGWLLRDFNPTIDDRYFYPLTPALQRLARSDERFLFADGARSPANTNLWYRIRSIGHYDGMGLHATEPLQRRLIGAGPGYTAATLRGLQLLGIRRAASILGRPLEGRVPELVPAWSDGPVSVYAVPGALPRFFTVGDARRPADDDDAIRIMTSPSFDPKRTVVVHDLPTAQARVMEGEGDVRVLAERPDTVRLGVTRSDPRWLVALQSRYPGWTAEVNGAPAPILRANVAFTAVAVPAGNSTVRLRYRPASVRVGAWISGATLAALVLFGAALVLCPRLRHRPEAAPDLH